MSLLLVFLAIAIAGGTITLASGRLRGSQTDAASSRRKRGGASEVDAMAEPAATMPPVLLPNHPDPRDIAGLRFSVAFRGYRMDQVDAVLKRLASDLVQRNELLAELRQRNELLVELRRQDGKARGH